ncbi:MAG: hypothetical protein K6U10_02475 [Acidobacteriia bacterium]|nr:hypothetical protein [Methyloceanibacter sp.]MBX5471632.1 hypothetical protein [Acetobacteraceae bacterium]MCL6490667.1 hypothetical protein [Terriglobia bacterium]
MREPQLPHFPLFPSNSPRTRAEEVGFRFGAVGTHTSRTMMLAELEAVLDAVPETGKWTDYAASIIEGNCLFKATMATRRLSKQRLSELYGLDPDLPLFRVLRRLWPLDSDSRPLLALLAAIARDPLLAATCTAVIPLPPGAELQREPMRAALRALVEDRLNERILEKVCRNAASSWTQSGHLKGRTFKKRCLVRATPTAVAFALYLGYAAGYRGADLFSSGWLQLLDCDPGQARQLALEAKRIGQRRLRRERHRRDEKHDQGEDSTEHVAFRTFAYVNLRRGYSPFLNY